MDSGSVLRSDPGHEITARSVCMESRATAMAMCGVERLGYAK
jgi:hypothetical protein